MSDLNESITVSAAQSANREILQNLRKNLRWFAAEFAVVVAGILVALALQAWWQDHQDADHGAEYQHQILSDVRTTERTLRESMARDKLHSDATMRLSAALYQSNALTHEAALDLLKFQRGWFADPRPILGNVNSLIQTGEIRLVHDPEIRAAIVSYASTMESAWQDRATQLERMYRSNDLEFSSLDEGRPASCVLLQGG